MAHNKINEMGQLDMFLGSSDLRITKPIRLIELFGGYGSQALSLKYLGADYEHHKLCEWAIPSIKAHYNCHCNKRVKTKLSPDEIRRWLYGRISADYNEPLSNEKIDKMKDKDVVDLYEMMVSDHNLGSVVMVHGIDLDIRETDEYTYILCYSFPCQDLSNAGLSKGMSRDSGTRSGMLWQVERMLKELYDGAMELPQILLMENVPQVCGEKNKEDFYEWLQFLESIGYHNKYEILNAKDYKVPQSRERCFCVSWRSDCQYHFPAPMELGIRMKHCLEKDVAAKYYLSDKTIENFIAYSEKKKSEGCGFTFNPSDGNRESVCVTSHSGQRQTDNFIIGDAYELGKSEQFGGSIIHRGDVCGTILTARMGGHGTCEGQSGEDAGVEQYAEST